MKTEMKWWIAAGAAVTAGLVGLGVYEETKKKKTASSGGGGGNSNGGGGNGPATASVTVNYGVQSVSVGSGGVLTINAPVNSASTGVTPVITNVASSNVQAVAGVTLQAGLPSINIGVGSAGTATLTVSWMDATGTAQTGTINVTVTP
jgi:hypothetical protein